MDLEVGFPMRWLYCNIFNFAGYMTHSPCIFFLWRWMTFLQHFLITKVKGYSSSHNLVGGRWVSEKTCCLWNRVIFQGRVALWNHFSPAVTIMNVMWLWMKVESFYFCCCSWELLTEVFFKCKLAPLKHSLVDEWNFLVLVRGVR